MKDRTDTGEQKTVLIVDGHALLRRTMREFLQGAFPEHDFLDMADGASALQACNAYRPILILIDRSLPDADGIELTARLKKLYPEVQLIVMAYPSEEIFGQRALAAGAREYLAKENLAIALIPAVAAAIGIEPATDRGTS